MEKIYNKLVRDNIPNIILNNNEIPVTRILPDEEYKKELYKKLIEECNELITAKTSDEIFEEAADVYEVLKSIIELDGKNIEELKEEASKKKLKRGGFTKKLFLEKVVTED